MLLSGQAAATEDPGTRFATSATTSVLDGDYAVEVTHSPAGAVLSRSRYSAEAEGQNLGTESRPQSALQTSQEEGSSFGIPLPSGCKTLTVHNKDYSTSGLDHLYTFTTWTSWCWDLADGRIYNVRTGWRFDPDSAFWGWDKIIDDNLTFYDWGTNDGSPRSGYYHMRQGQVESKFGFYNHPKNILRVNSWGNWTWTSYD